MSTEVFEEWIAHPDKYAYAPAEEHSKYASSPGWYATDWRGDAAAVEQRKRRMYRPAPPPVVEEDESE